jgi:Flp pilus assembly pilin Flp
MPALIEAGWPPGRVKKGFVMFSRFLSDNRGMETVEWAIMAALIVAGVAAVVASIGTHVKSSFGKLQNATS